MVVRKRLDLEPAPAPPWNFTFVPVVIKTCVLLAVVSSIESWAQYRGPIELPTDYPLTDLHLGIPSASADGVAEGQQKIEMQLSWSNVSNYNVEGVQAADDVPSCDETRESCYVVDAEVRKARLRYRAGLDEATEIQFHIPLIWRGGGNLDNAVEQFHEGIGVSSGVRGQVVQDQFEIRGRDGDSSFNFDDDGFAIGNLVTGIKTNVYQTSSSSTAVQAQFSWPTSRGSFGHNGVDFSGALLHRESFSEFALFFGAGPVMKSDTSHYGIDYHRVHGEGFATLEYVLNQQVSVIVGAHASTRIVDGIADHPGTAAYLDTGLKAGIYGIDWELLLRENISSGSGTTDFTMMLGAGVIF